MATVVNMPLCFGRLNPAPLDASSVFNTLEARDSSTEKARRYEGMIAYVQENKQLYLLKGGIENVNWIPLNTKDMTEDSIKSYSAKSEIQAGQIVRLINSTDIEVANMVDKYDGVIGVAMESVSGSEDSAVSVKVKLFGECSVSHEGDLEVGKMCYLGNNGQAIQSMVDNMNALVPIGMAISEDSVSLNINDNEVVKFE